MAKDKKEYVEIEGIKCEVKDPERKAVTLYYQDSLRDAISDYERSVSRWVESKKAYRDGLKINVIIAPFVLGWLKKPEDPDEYLVITGRITMDELKKKRAKEAAKNKKTKKRSTRKKTTTNKKTTNSPKTIKKTATKRSTTSKSTTKKKTTKKSETKSNSPKKAKSSPKKKATPKKGAASKKSSKKK